MMRVLLNRLGQAAFVVWAVGSLSFLLMRLLPGDMAFRIAAGRYGYDNVNIAAAELVRAELGLDRPAWQLYLQWLGDLLTFNLGESLVSGLPVNEELQHLLGHTLLLAGTAMVISLLIAVPVGLYAAMRQRGWFDRVSLTVAILLRAQPVFVIGLLLILLFSLQLRWLPVAGFDGWAFLVLPAVSLALAMAAVSSRIVRNSAAQALQTTWFAFAQWKGLAFHQALVRHGLRNIAVPVVTFLGIQLISLIEGVVMIESLFSWPGIGHGLAHAVFSRDVPMIQGAALCMGLVFVVLNLLVDLACLAIDPRGRADA